MEVRMTLSDHMSRQESGRRSLRSVLDSEQHHRDSTTRTLMDIIREDHAISRGQFPLSTPTAANGTSWRFFKDRLRLRRTTAAFASDHDNDLVIGLPTSPVFGPAMAARLQSTAMSRRDTVDTPAEAAADAAAQAPSPPQEEEQPVRVSLMALLGQAEEDDDGGEEVENEEEEAEVVAATGAEGMYHVCCVCMVRHKGAAFIPCGHTFCRLCSRELWVSRGNCPLCNGYILEILDIF